MSTARVNPPSESEVLAAGNRLIVRFPLIRFLDTNGDGTGTKNAIGNYSGAATPFYIAPPADQVYSVTELLIQLSDNGAFGQSVWGSMASALTNGLLIRAKRNTTVVLDILDGIPIKTNDQLSHLTSRVTLLTWSGSTNTLQASFTTAEFGTPLYLNGALDESLEIVCNDDFSGLIDQTFVVHGYVLS
jgi:hypothetical protein